MLGGWLCCVGLSSTVWKGLTIPMSISTNWSCPVYHQPAQAVLLRDLFGNPFQPVKFAKKWRSESAVSLARTAYDTHNFSLLPILADALEEAGCDHADILAHCREPNGVHARGCWVVDLVLNKS